MIHQLRELLPKEKELAKAEQLVLAQIKSRDTKDLDWLMKNWHARDLWKVQIELKLVPK